ncbi:predicted protein [Histoplasma capsulatum G186AR]|uniref:Uncharacterized protein n=1 Tax=Ajellomyces capsulatus (strain G186AR / H82 / ATCC MYA-2454 / RMSCC 2432) TaxID=447093 RepID=C0NTF2_AJECG|nr:uncharacterized protein HCBG_06432 [Histoplasma capsulatum G186AR]EEH05313.1 predicted protein [Histoplasma capsulatum G186AR]
MSPGSEYDASPAYADMPAPHNPLLPTFLSTYDDTPHHPDASRSNPSSMPRMRLRGVFAYGTTSPSTSKNLAPRSSSSLLSLNVVYRNAARSGLGGQRKV